MPETKQPKKQGLSTDWLLRGALTRIGDIFDRFTGRGWKPSSSLATSELIERLKLLLDSEARTENGHTFVPHNIKLKMQWDKCSTDSPESLIALENEFLTAAVDHVNDKRYYTHAPFHVEAKPDYFTSGVKLFVSFDKSAEESDEAGITVSVPGGTAELPASGMAEPISAARTLTVRYSFGDNPFQKELQAGQGARLSVGRTKENDLSIDDPSLSKYHASMTFDRDGNLLIADTGSTNGTFVNGERIAYGKAVIVTELDKVRFGLIDVEFVLPPKPVKEAVPELPKTESYTIGDIEFTKRLETVAPATIAATFVSEQPKTAPEVSMLPTQPSLSPPVSTEVETGEDVAPQPQLTSDSIELNIEKKDEIDIP